MSRYDKEFVILKDGAPLRYYKDGQIKTYMTRENAEKQVRIEVRTIRESNDYWTNKRRPDLVSKIPKFEVGRFSAIDLQEVTLDGE